MQQAAGLLGQGQLVAIPTETVYGLAANAFDPEAVTRVFAAKERPAFDPLIVHVATVEQAMTLTAQWPEQATALCEAFWPGPLTLLLPKNNRISDFITAGSPRVALRMPRHPLARQLLQALEFPLVAPSANPFGYISPTTAMHVEQQLGPRISYILDGGACEVGLESTIVGFEGDETVVYRKGGLAVEEVESVVGSVRVMAHSSSNPQAPGMLKSHYAPRAPVFVFDRLDFVNVETSRVGFLLFQQPLVGVPAEQQRVLSTEGDLAEAARSLFSCMRSLDAENFDRLYVELAPEVGLGCAINDRLRRAAAA